MDSMAASTALWLARSFLSAVPMIPVPRRLVRIRRSPGRAPGVREHALGIHQPGHRVTELDLLVADRVAANHRAACFLHLGVAALENAFQDVEIASRVRKTHNGERRNRPASHGVNVAQRVGRGDLAEGVRVVHDGREEVHGLDQRQVGRELIHSRVVGGLKAYQDVRVGLFRQLGQHGVQNTWTQLGRSTRRLDHRGQPLPFVHSCEIICPARTILKCLFRYDWASGKRLGPLAWK